MFDYTDSHITLRTDNNRVCTARQALNIINDPFNPYLPTAVLSAHYGTTPVALDDDEPLCALIYVPGIPGVPPIAVHFGTAERIMSLYGLLSDRPLAWLFELYGWERPPGNPPSGIILPVLVGSSTRRGHACGVSQQTVAEINAAFLMLALRTPGVWHGKLSVALGVPRPGRKTQLFRGAIIDGNLVPRRLDEGGIVLRPVNRNRR